MSNPEDVLEKVLSGELTREEAVRQHPDIEDRLLLLTSLADELRELPRQAPDPDFRNRTRLRLLQHIQETQQRPPSWWQRLLDLPVAVPGWASRVSAAAIAAGGLTFGVAYASASALPDDGLYRVKRGLEQVQVALARSDEARANTYLDLADRRAAEIAATAGDLDESRLDGLTQDYGSSLQLVSQAIQVLPAPGTPLLDKVQAHVASQATELEARALNSGARPRVQQRLIQAEVVASNVVDHVTLIAEKSGKPGPYDVHLANNPPAAATAAAASLASPTASAPASPTAAPATADSAPAASAPAAPVSAPPAPASAQASAAPAPPPPAGVTTFDGQLDRLWNQVAAAPFMGQKVRAQLQGDVTTAKQALHAGQKDAARAALTAFISQLDAAVKANQATQYTAAKLTGDAKGILAAI
jgi:hypothetical protein